MQYNEVCAQGFPPFLSNDKVVENENGSLIGFVDMPLKIWNLKWMTKAASSKQTEKPINNNSSYQLITNELSLHKLQEFLSFDLETSLPLPSDKTALIQ